MKFKLFTRFTLLTLAVIAFISYQAAQTYQSTGDPQLDAVVERAMRQHNVPGAAVAVVKNGEVKIGQSSKKDVQLLFGAPSSVTRGSVQVASQANPSQMITVVETWGYQHTEARVDGRSWIPFAGAWLRGTNYETEQVMFGFDGKDVVQQVSSSSQAGRVKAWGVQSQ